jgi:hypothetical protein
MSVGAPHGGAVKRFRLIPGRGSFSLESIASKTYNLQKNQNK